MNTQSIYLDYNSTTPLDPDVYKSMEPYLKTHFGNPSSQGHSWGWTAESAVKEARKKLAEFLNCDAKEIYFTSGATESNNWALFGVFHYFKRTFPQEPLHMISTGIEHNSVLNTLKYLQSLGVEVDFLPVNKLGLIDIQELESRIKPSTRLISIMWVNNEIGTINPIEEIASIAKKNKIYFHTDGTQAIGKIPVDLKNSAIDMMSFSGHKIYGPKGIGAFYKRKKDPYVQIDPFFFGGGQEHGERSGTLNVPGIVGLGAACEILKNHLSEEIRHYQHLSEKLLSGLKSLFPEVKLNGPSSYPERSPMNLSLTFPETLGQDLGSRLIGLGVSSASACSTGKVSSSHVLKGIGLSQEQASSTLRLSVGRMTKESDIETVLSIFKKLMI